LDISLTRSRSGQFVLRDKLKISADSAANEMASRLRQGDSHFIKFVEKADWDIDEDWFERFF
jgi:hypothetical protein